MAKLFPAVLILMLIVSSCKKNDKSKGSLVSNPNTSPTIDKTSDDNSSEDSSIKPEPPKDIDEAFELEPDADKEAPINDRKPSEDSDESRSERSYAIIFSTDRKVSSLGTISGSNENGISNFDKLCAMEASEKGLAGEFKAVIADGENRFPCTSALCSEGNFNEALDWVLSPNTEYRLPNSTTIIGKTDNNSLLEFELENAVSLDGKRVWSGLLDDWTSSTNNCDQWSSDLGSSQGSIGDLSKTGHGLINLEENSRCDQKRAILCASRLDKEPQIVHQSFKKIFLTEEKYRPGRGNGLYGVEYMDSICAHEAIDKNLEGTYKAFIASNHKKLRWGFWQHYWKKNKSSFHSKNWVLKPNTEYRREDGETVITRTQLNPTFKFPLFNSISELDVTYWSPHSYKWTYFMGGNHNSCANWLSRSFYQYGKIGRSSKVTYRAIFSGISSCSVRHHLACVEQ